MIRETMYAGMSITNVNLHEVPRMLSKMRFETDSNIIRRNTYSKGPAVIKIADTLQSHFSAAVGKTDGQSIKWMVPKRAITPIAVQVEGKIPRTSVFSIGE